MALGGILILFFGAYAHLAADGSLGATAQAKYETQSQSRLGVPLAARYEFIFSYESIRRYPLFGRGSQDILGADEAGVGVARLRALGIRYQRVETTASDLVPTHSHIFDAWVKYGLLGALFWLALIRIFISALVGIRGAPPVARLMVAYLGILESFDILFNPFGADRRLQLAFGLAVIALARAKDVSADV